MSSTSIKSIFNSSLSDEIAIDETVSKHRAEDIFNFFKSCLLFRWQDANNDCEDRANAICILLDAWNIPNYKAWVFSGYFLKKENSNLINYWNYHVAASLPVKENDGVKHYVIDPATSEVLVTIDEWASGVTGTPFSHHLIKESNYYIFSSKKIERDNWHKRDKRNYRWTMQGLSGINGVSSIGKAHLRFNKHRVERTETRFNELKEQGIPSDFSADAVTKISHAHTPSQMVEQTS